MYFSLWWDSLCVGFPFLDGAPRIAVCRRVGQREHHVRGADSYFRLFFIVLSTQSVPRLPSVS